MLSLRSANWLLEMHYLPARIQQKQIKRMPYHTEHQENTSHESIEFSTLAKTCTKFTTKQNALKLNPWHGYNALQYEYAVDG